VEGSIDRSTTYQVSNGLFCSGRRRCLSCVLAHLRAPLLLCHELLLDGEPGIPRGVQHGTVRDRSRRAFCDVAEGKRHQQGLLATWGTRISALAVDR
jgi:hypothetical protein